jgi:hypothetical protein
MLTYNSLNAITVTKRTESEFHIKIYDLLSFDRVFSEKIFGNPYNCIKLKEVEQNSSGTYFAIVYLDDGVFKLRTFGTEPRDKKQIANEELNINNQLKLSNDTVPLNNLPEPFITCCFVTDDLIFVTLFHTGDFYHHEFYTY